MIVSPGCRPDPDTLLAHVQDEERQKCRGKLKIFLGYIAGVGKTYEMLKAAHLRKHDGIDVRIGYIETHGRTETEALVEGLVVIPRSQIEYRGVKLTVPTEAEILRIKGVLILKRNATRDYLDFVALAEHMGAEKMVEALRPFDHLYPQPNEQSALQQMLVQLADPLPYDLEELNLAEYRHLDPRWSDWQTVKAACADDATLLFDHIVGLED